MFGPTVTAVGIVHVTIRLLKKRWEAERVSLSSAHHVQHQYVTVKKRLNIRIVTVRHKRKYNMRSSRVKTTRGGHRVLRQRKSTAHVPVVSTTRGNLFLHAMEMHCTERTFVRARVSIVPTGDEIFHASSDVALLVSITLT